MVTFAVGDPCLQPQQQGQGNANLRRWSYDANQRTCVPFVYRGLKGTQNNFLTKEDCEITCDGEGKASIL